MLALLWAGILAACWIASVLVAYQVGRLSLEREAVYAAVETMLRRAQLTGILADSVERALGH